MEYFEFIEKSYLSLLRTQCEYPTRHIYCRYLVRTVPFMLFQNSFKKYSGFGREPTRKKVGDLYNAKRFSPQKKSVFSSMYRYNLYLFLFVNIINESILKI
jgi:hypothetical protein